MEVSEYNIQLAANKDEHIKLNITPERLEFGGSQHIPNRTFSREEAEGAIKLNTTRIGGITFSAKIGRRVLFRCSQETYNAIEDWLGYEAVLRMEFRGFGGSRPIIGVFLLYQAFNQISAYGWALWGILSVISGVLLLTLGPLAWLRPNRSILLYQIAAWVLVGVRSLWGIYLNGHWIEYVFLVVSLLSIYPIYSRYGRLVALSKAV